MHYKKLEHKKTLKSTCKNESSHPYIYNVHNTGINIYSTYQCIKKGTKEKRKKTASFYIYKDFYIVNFS